MLVRNTVSGEVRDLPAEKTLGHPWFSQFYVPVTKPKNEVLAQPYKVDENGEREILPTHQAVDGAQPAKAPKPSDIKKGEDK